MTRPSYHTRHARRALALAAQMCKAQYAGVQPTPADLARLFCALQEGSAGFSPDQVWTWDIQECVRRVECSIETRPATAQLEGREAA